jgi:hypothetical protein
MYEICHTTLRVFFNCINPSWVFRGNGYVIQSEEGDEISISDSWGESENELTWGAYKFIPKIIRISHVQPRSSTEALSSVYITEAKILAQLVEVAGSIPDDVTGIFH